MSVARRREWIDPAHNCLSIGAQCRLLSISRSSNYYAPLPETEETLALMRVIDAAFLNMPWYGSRQMVRHLRRNGHDVGRRRVRRLMGRMGGAAQGSNDAQHRWKAAEGCRRSTSSRARVIRTRSTGFIPICCASWRSSGRTMSGART
jgi:putative transposase